MSVIEKKPFVNTILDSLTANDVIDVRVKAGGNCDMTVINATISVRRIS